MRPTADSIQAVLVLDNGTGMITGQALQGRNDDRGSSGSDLLAPVASLGADNVRDGNKGGTDHLSFIPYGVPGWNFDQESRGYNHTHHSQVDTYDHAVPDDLKQASAVMAVTALRAGQPAGAAAARAEDRGAAAHGDQAVGRTRGAPNGPCLNAMSRPGRPGRLIAFGTVQVRRQRHRARRIEPASHVVDRASP